MLGYRSILGAFGQMSAGTAESRVLDRKWSKMFTKCRSNAVSRLLSKEYKELCDNEMQLMTAMEDKNYTLWLAGEQCYRKDVSVNHYNK